MKNHFQKDATLNREGTLGTFSGVFTPSILTILGIILFLRLGLVTGAAVIGLLGVWSCRRVVSAPPVAVLREL